jgi:dihydrofolate synthase/folylpolyglutamate synthase
MDYNEVLEYLIQLDLFGMKLGLDNTNKILSYLGDPHKSFPSIHIAGTNGKGSTAAILESILANSGYRIGMYTSPHLVDFRERIRINAKLINQEYIVDFFADIREKFQLINPTYFEAVTALAFKYFCDEKVDLAIIETGLGGRFDATNVLIPVVSVITNIDLEHTRHLGNDIEKIAFEKAGIIKNGIPAVTAIKHAGAHRVIEEVSQQREAKLISIFDETRLVIKEINERTTELDIFTQSQRYHDLCLTLPGRHQLDNAICSIIAAELAGANGLKLTTTGVSIGFKDVKWPGRLQRLSNEPEVILDVGHNPAAMKSLYEYFEEFCSGRCVIAIFGVLSDKDSNQMLADLNRFADVIIIAKPNTNRAANPETLAKQASQVTNNFQVIQDVGEAYDAALKAAKKSDIVLVTGSHYTVGEVLSHTGNMA